MGAESFSAFLTTLLWAINMFNPALVDPELRMPDRKPEQLKQKYDFVIIGAGSAGSVVASRLSENKNWNVLLLESGEDETYVSETPRMVFHLWQTESDWHYTTVPQENACQFEGGRCFWPRGRIVGGSSATNTMFYTRCNKRDYDNWVTLGNPGWGYKDVLPYFLRSQDQTNQEYAKNKKYHSKGGYLTTSDSPWQPQLARDFVEGGKQLGFEERDINAEKQTGFMMFHGTVRNGSKCSAAKAFLRPARHRSNLHLATKSTVTKIIIDPNTLTAGAVEFLREGKRYTAKANKEVILSAGTINSPQILMLSGIGPRRHLRENGIRVIRDLPVGEGLHDHLAVLLEFKSNQTVSNSYSVYSTVQSAVSYAKEGKGPLTSGAIDALGLFHSKSTSSYLDYPDIGVLLLGEPLNDSQTAEIWNLFPFLVKPKSRGNIRLASADPLAIPLIDPRYLTDKSDKLALMEAVNYAIRLSKTRGMLKHGATFNDASYKACSHIKPTFDDIYISCLVGNYSMTFFHPVGTCRMGPSYDSRSVVNSRLQVHGIRRLRVIDGSIMPEVVNAPTNAPIMMIAEKGADFIKSYWT